MHHLGDTNVNETVFFIPNPDCALLIRGKASASCLLILYPMVLFWLVPLCLCIPHPSLILPVCPGGLLAALPLCLSPHCCSGGKPLRNVVWHLASFLLFPGSVGMGNLINNLTSLGVTSEAFWAPHTCDQVCCRVSTLICSGFELNPGFYPHFHLILSSFHISLA